MTANHHDLAAPLHYDPYVLKSIKKIQAVLPPEPTIVMESDGSVSKMMEIKLGKKYDRWLTRT